MLLYRPLLAAYQSAQRENVRRYLLRELAYPLFHSEPDESLAVLREAASDSLQTVPARLLAEVNLSEQLSRLRLTTRDPTRETGGLWTVVHHSRSFVGWNRNSLPKEELTRIAALSLGPVAMNLLNQPDGDQRAWVLATLGDLGVEKGLEVLVGQLRSGRLTGPAAIGLTRLGTAEAGVAVRKVIEERGLEYAGTWLGLVLSAFASAELVPLLNRAILSTDGDVREQAAIALQSFGPYGVDALLDGFRSEPLGVVRLNVLLSVSRLNVPIPMAQLQRLCRAEDPEILKVAALRAAARAGGEAARPFLEHALRQGPPAEQAEAIEALVVLGSTPDTSILGLVRAAAASAHPRTSLSALLALSVWAPEEAFAQATRLFQTSSSSQWCIATYALRYIRTDQTAPCLMKLLKVVRGTELEEVVVSALSRHLEKPLVLETLLAQIQPSTGTPTLHRILEDLTRHLPNEMAPAAADHLRRLLGAQPAAAFADPILVAMGALGNRGDMQLLADFLLTPAVHGAIRGIELMMDRNVAGTLDELARRATARTREAAIVALYRLGMSTAEEHLVALAGSTREEDLASATRALFQMAVSVRCIGSVSRLVLLRQMLQERQPPRAQTAEEEALELPDLDAVVPAEELALEPEMGASELADAVAPVDEPEETPTQRFVRKPGQPPTPRPVPLSSRPVEPEEPEEPEAPPPPPSAPELDLSNSVHDMLTKPRPTVKARIPVGALAPAPSGSPRGVYRDLGHHLMASGLGGEETPTRRYIILGAIFLLGTFYLGHLTQANADGDAPALPRHGKRYSHSGRSGQPGESPRAVREVPTIELKGEITRFAGGQMIVRAEGKMYLVEDADTHNKRVGDVFNARVTPTTVDALGFIHVTTK